MTGPYDFTDELQTAGRIPEHRRSTARPDLKAAVQNVELAKINHKLAVANGSTDPTFSVWWTHNPPFNNPYDYNTSASASAFRCASSTGTRARRRGRRSTSAATSGCGMPPRRRCSATWIRPTATLVSTLNLLRPYQDEVSEAGRRTFATEMSFSYQNGGASLLDYLDAEKVLPRHAAGLPESDWFVSDRGGANEHGRGPGGSCNESIRLVLAIALSVA